MAHTQKINIIIEAELHEREPNSSGQASADTNPTEYAYEQALFSALRANPERYAEFIKTQVLAELNATGVHRQLPQLAQIKDTYTASIKVLESVLPTLPEASQKYLQDALTEGWIMDDPDSIYNTVEVKLLQLTVEYPTRQ